MYVSPEYRVVVETSICEVPRLDGHGRAVPSAFPIGPTKQQLPATPIGYGSWILVDGRNLIIIQASKILRHLPVNLLNKRRAGIMAIAVCIHPFSARPNNADSPDHDQAVGQICSTASMTHNLEQCVRLVSKAAAAGAKVYMIPSYFSSLPGASRDLSAMAVWSPSPMTP